MFVWYFKDENTLRFWRLCGRIEKTRRKETTVTLQQLRYVTAVAGTIRHAVQQFYISQPSLTNAIRELEQEVGLALSKTESSVVSQTLLEYLRSSRQRKDGRHLDFVSKYTSHAKDGTEREISAYRCEDCSDCPYRSVCCKAKDENRRKEISVCWEFQKMRQKSYQNITTEEGKLLRCNRSIQAEGAFGQLKHNRSFKRFLTGGNIKVLAELLFLGLSQNIAHFISKCNSGLQKQHLIHPKAYLKF